MSKAGLEPSGASPDEPAGPPPGTAPPPGTREHGPPGRWLPRIRRGWVLAAGGAVAAAALAAGVAAALHAAPHVARTAGTPSPPSPLSALTSALAATSARSYAFTIATTVQLPKKELTSDVVSGAYDPVQRLGTELVTASEGGQPKRAQVRFIGAWLYTWVSPADGFTEPWDKSPAEAGASAAMPPGVAFGFASDQPVSPSALTVVLRAPGAAVRRSGPASGPGWAGTGYAFTASLYGGRESVTGTVDVDGQGRARQMTVTTVQDGGQPRRPFLTTIRRIMFSGLGAPVQVTPPPAGQVKTTSGQPYWGFYF
jgi:hypothetical protein